MRERPTVRPSLKPGIQRLLLGLAFVWVATGAGHGQDAGNIDVRGVWAEGNRLLVFANVMPCKDCYPPPGVAVLLVSTDGGRTWKKGGPGLAGYEFRYVYEKDGKVWIAGEHTCEGPSTDPFIFVPAGENKWEFHRIEHDNETVDSLGWGTNGELNAWITYIRLEDLERDRTFVYQSLDSGKTWKRVGLAGKDKPAPQSRFIQITHHMQPLWRVVTRKKCSGSLVQHRDAEGAPWKTVATFADWHCPRKKSEQASTSYR